MAFQFTCVATTHFPLGPSGFRRPQMSYRLDRQDPFAFLDEESDVCLQVSFREAPTPTALQMNDKLDDHG